MSTGDFPVYRPDGWYTNDGGLSWHHPAPHAARGPESYVQTRTIKVGEFVASSPYFLTAVEQKAIARALAGSVRYLDKTPEEVLTDELLDELWCRAALPSGQFRAKARELLTAAFHAKPEYVKAPDVAEAVRQDEPTDRRVRASSAGGEEK